MHPLSSFLRSTVLPFFASTFPSVEAPTFVRFLTFAYWVLSLSYFSHFAVSYFSYFAVTFFLHKNSCTFSYYLSFLLPDEACGRKVVNSTVCCSSVCCSLNYLTRGAPASQVRFVRVKSWVRVYRRPSQVQLMRGEILETALYCSGVVSVFLGAIA